jgi:cytochrome c oxidase assembly factor CtaG
MNTSQLLLKGWTFRPDLLLLTAAVLGVYVFVYGFRWRFGFAAGAVGVFLLALTSPINALADGYLFSAHMVQHILLLLIVPAFALLSLPPSFELPAKLRTLANPIACWVAGVGAMWLWHAPALCNAAVDSRAIYATQAVSLLVFGAAFWWQVLAPGEDKRLAPLAGIGYLFSACAACSVLGIILTFSPVAVCTVYMHPADRLGLLSTIRNSWGFTPERDQQIGGLLMWVPMCFIYLTAILGEIARWYGPVVDPEWGRSDA